MSRRDYPMPDRNGNSPRAVPKKDFSIAMAKLLLGKIIAQVPENKPLTLFDGIKIREFSQHAIDRLNEATHK